MESTSADLSKPSWCPAPYGQTCAGCVRAKCKCFFQPGGQTCERCHRLGKECEPSGTVRKRRARKERQPSSSARLEQKPNETVSLLRSQSSRSIRALDYAVNQEQGGNDTPSSTSALVAGYHPPRSPTRAPEVMIDTENNHLQLLRSTDTMVSSQSKPKQSPIFEDVSKHTIPEAVAEARLNQFRESFLPMFPFVHIPLAMRSSELRKQKPFLWLMAMCLTARLVDEQFLLESKIWAIISRIVVEHLADLDLLLGTICFSAWSHYFKNDKPFMTTVTSIAVSMAYELNLHKKIEVRTRRTNNGSWTSHQLETEDPVRPLEEYRSFIAVFHLSSATWTAYRKVDPLGWSSYLEECLRIVGEGNETHLDTLLAIQVKCQIMSNRLTYIAGDNGTGLQIWDGPPIMLLGAMLDNLKMIRQNLSDPTRRESVTDLYLHGAELLIRDFILRRPSKRDDTGHLHLQRLQDLNSTLTLAERWIEIFFGMPTADWIGQTVDVFTQFLHCLVVLFKLITLNEPGWDVAEVRRRADIFKILDHACDTVDRVTTELGMVDADGPRHGLFFKSNYLFRTIKALLLAEMEQDRRPGPALYPLDNVYSDFNAVFSDPNWVPEDFMMSVANEPWMSDIFMSSWDLEFSGQPDFSRAS
ncbi:hypothetical protein F5Y19DRAFT_429452 [Xylariaceae sp. FL1651]|nr:hypothetical protein F5Y19DRAFT_429452 [Xylariaceae sp. FL1651]